MQLGVHLDFEFKTKTVLFFPLDPTLSLTSNLPYESLEKNLNFFET